MNMAGVLVGAKPYMVNERAQVDAFAGHFEIY
jgi:hypothetical protein